MSESATPSQASEDQSDEAPASPQSETWARTVLGDLAFAAVKEQRRARRWGLVFKLFMLVYLVALPLLYLPSDLLTFDDEEQHTALVELSGVISAGTDASADRVVGALRAAFKDEKTAGVVLRINSPGGSPVQSGYINDEIGRLRKKYPAIPIYAVIADMAASGGYYVAVAADKIYADKASLVGSIGVLMNGFGFVDAMEKLGVERRLVTAGENKAFLDPFSPTKVDDVAHIQGLLEQIHRQFIDVVKAGRGDRLKSDAQLFSGYVWSGETGVKLGLVDALGNSSYVAREVIGVERMVNFTAKRGHLEAIAERLGASIAKHLRLEMSQSIPELR